MSQVSTWAFYAYKIGDPDGIHDERREGVPEWRLDDVIRWARFRGYDAIYLQRDGAGEFELHPSQLDHSGPVTG